MLNDIINVRKNAFDPIIITNALSKNVNSRKDIIMNKIYGELSYIGRDILKIVLPLKFVFPGNVYFLYLLTLVQMINYHIEKP